MFLSQGLIAMCLVLRAKMELSISSLKGCLHRKNPINERKQNCFSQLSKEVDPARRVKTSFPKHMIISPNDWLYQPTSAKMTFCMSVQ